MKSSKQNKELYFIALVPDEPVLSEVWQLKEEMKRRFETKAALRSPPHITLHMPFKWSATKELLLYNTLEQIGKSHRRFTIELKGYGAFEPRVIYVNVSENIQLAELQNSVIKKAASEWHIYPMRDSRPFRPHMTIAFRDLKKAKFYEAWQEFEDRNFAQTMSVHKLHLLKHTGKHWEIQKSFDLGT